MARIRSHWSKPGSAPGVLPTIPDRAFEAATVRVAEYDAERFDEREVTGVEELDALLGRRETVTWVDVEGLRDTDLLTTLGTTLGLHPLALEDVVHTHQRPKVEEYGDHCYLVIRLPRQAEELTTEQVSMFLGLGWVLTIREPGPDPFGSVRERLRSGRPRIRGGGADYLGYALLDSLIDTFFPLLESYGERIESLEDELLDRPERRALESVHDIRTDLFEIRRSTWPLRELIHGLERQDLELITEQTRPYLRDCHDHALQLMDIVQTYRDMAGALIDLYLSSVSNRMNEVMKVLTVIAAIFIPLTFMAGIYGMNFNPEASPWNMPELNWKWGYPLFWAVILVLGGGLVWLFRRKDWL